MTDYELAFPFILDDAAYEVGRGTRPAALLDASEEAWRAHEESVGNSMAAHGVVIVWRDGVLVAAAPWVVDMWDHAQTLPDRLCHALIGLLLGYAPPSIEAFLATVATSAEPEATP